MDYSKMRNQSFCKDLSPVCTKIKNVSWDMFASIQSKKLSNLKLQPITSNPPAEDLKQSLSRVSKLSIHSKNDKSKRRLEKLPSLPVPRISDVSVKSQFEDISLREKTVQKCEIDPNNHEKPQKISHRKSTFNQIASPKSSNKNKLNSLQKVTYLEASTYPEWSIIAKPDIEKMWKNLFYDSNGLLPIKVKTGFKYFIGQGQVSLIVRKLLNSRTWWTETSNVVEANFIWVDQKEKQIFKILPKISNKNFEIDSESPSFVFQVPVKIDEIYRLVDLSDLGMGKIKNSQCFARLKPSEYNPSLQKLYNKVEFSQFFASKKKLMETLKIYYESIGKHLFSYCPATLIVKKDFLCENSVKLFVKTHSDKSKKKSKNFWTVMKEDQLRYQQETKICRNLSEIQKNLENFKEGETVILEKHLNHVFLSNNRKIVIKFFVFFTFFNGVTQVYLYEEGCVYRYPLDSVKNENKSKISDEEEKNEENSMKDGKKVFAYTEFVSNFKEKKSSFVDAVFLKVKEVVKDTVLANQDKIFSQKRMNCMEIFFYDFLLDAQLKPWLLDIGPIDQLDINCQFLDEIIKDLIENSLRISLDCFFPQSTFTSKTFEPISENKFQLIYHEKGKND